MTYLITPPECKWALPQVDSAELIFASWVRVIEGAPIENRPALLVMMATDASVYADAVKQQIFDDLWTIAEQLGLVKLIGPTSVQEKIAAGLGDAA